MGYIGSGILTVLGSNSADTEQTVGRINVHYERNGRPHVQGLVGRVDVGRTNGGRNTGRVSDDLR